MGRKKSEHSKRRMIGFTASQYAWLKKESDRLEIKVSEFVRRIVDEKREEERKK